MDLLCLVFEWDIELFRCFTDSSTCEVSRKSLRLIYLPATCRQKNTLPRFHNSNVVLLFLHLIISDMFSESFALCKSVATFIQLHY